MRRSLIAAALLSAVAAAGLVGGWYAGRITASPAQAITGESDLAMANGPAPNAPGLTAIDALTLRADRNLYDGYPAKNPDDSVNVIVEIPAGTNAKWEVTKNGILQLEVRDGVPRTVKFLPYPGNYGMIPRTSLPKEQGGDGDALDVLILGPTLTRGTVARVRLIGVMKFHDKGERDDKLLAVTDNTPLGKIRSLTELNEAFPEVSTIVLTWFKSYKGPGKMKFNGWGDADEAIAILEGAIAVAAP